MTLAGRDSLLKKRLLLEPRSLPDRDDFAHDFTSELRRAGACSANYEMDDAMEIINLGATEGLPPVDLGRRS